MPAVPILVEAHDQERNEHALDQHEQQPVVVREPSEQRIALAIAEPVNPERGGDQIEAIGGHGEKQHDAHWERRSAESFTSVVSDGHLARAG